MLHNTPDTLHARRGHPQRSPRREDGQDSRRLGHRGHGADGSPGPGRFVAYGDLRLIILHVTAERPRQGHEIVKAIKERVGTSHSPSPGVIYPILALLEELGYVGVSEPSEGKREMYDITLQGRAFLEANRLALETLLARTNETGRARNGRSTPQVVRAIETLNLALRQRLSRGRLSAEQADDVASALEAAADSMEQI